MERTGLRVSTFEMAGAASESRRHNYKALYSIFATTTYLKLDYGQ